MSDFLGKYEIKDRIHEGLKTVIYRGIRRSDQTPVILKVLKPEYPTFAEVMRLRHEYQILQTLNLDCVTRTYGLENHNKGLALILEDFGGLSLEKLRGDRQISVIKFLNLAIQLAATLVQLHKHRTIHKDIKPDNIIVNPVTWQLKLTDFSIATQLSRETQPPSNPELLEGTLAYMSPEQTGRMNRAIDYRSDFYSLGVTFYKILSDRLPFPTKDPLELVYCHLAKTPVSLHQINPEIPEAISAIVMKLMAKNAEDRYQSARGLQADLEICLRQIFQHGKIEQFTPGKLDKSGQFLIPQKLYGREAEVATLMAAFNRVALPTPSESAEKSSVTPPKRAELILISGYSGIGKTSVIQEVHKPILSARGYFISGKFDQYKRNIPYAALLQACQDLMQQLLTEPGEKIVRWQEKLLAALGNNGQVILEVIPELERIIGKQPAVPTLGPTESQNRFQRVFQQFLSVFIQPEHPLVLFLDDLQWVDLGSLKLIEQLILNPENHFLLMVGAYRDNEVYPTHPLVQTISILEKAGASLSNLVLKPLQKSHVVRLIGDTLGYSGTIYHQLTDASPLVQLAGLLWHKTGGNPFFLTQLLQTLYEEHLITFDFREGRWQWDIARIQAHGITDWTVVGLVARNIQKLPQPTQDLLKLAACIGDRFTLEVLAVVSQQSLIKTSDELWEGLQAGLILPLSPHYQIPGSMDWEMEGNLWSFDNSKINYKFLHDRVQQAAYSLIPSSEKQATHLQIGRLLLENHSRDEIESNIFDIVNQLNRGRELITRSQEQDELARLNLRASRKAKVAAAYEAAAQYARLGLERLNPQSWASEYELIRDVYIEGIETEYLTANFSQAIQLAQVALVEVTDPLDHVKICELEMQIYIAQLEMVTAIAKGIELLKTLGVELTPLQPEDSLVLPLPSLDDLDRIPPLTDPYKLSALRILTTLCAPIFFAQPEIFAETILTMVNFCIQEGNSPLAAFAYAFYGLFLSSLGEIDAGYHSGQIALKLLDKFEAKQLAAKVYNLFNAHNRPWKEHGKKSLPQFIQGVQTGLETGDIEWACYCAGNYCGFSFLTEDRLDKVVEKQQDYIKIAQKSKIETAIYYGSAWRQLGLNLLGEASDVTQLTGASFDEVQMLPRLRDSKSGTVLFMVYLCKMILFYQFQRYGEAVEQGILAKAQEGSALGYFQVAVLNFYDSLARLATYPHLSSDDRVQALHQVETNQLKMKNWAFYAPMNFQHKYDLVAAELSAVLGEHIQAMELYDQAITGAKAQGYAQDEAIANERAAEFYFSLQKETIAKAYLIEAYYTYIRWGARAKLDDLESRYPQVFSRIINRNSFGIDVTRTNTSTTGSHSAALDLAATIKASQAISQEDSLDRRVENLMQILLENAGARKGLLLKAESGWFTIIAQKQIDDPIPSIPTSTARPALGKDLPLSMVEYVYRTGESVLLDRADQEGAFTQDPYIQHTQTHSILCLPLLARPQAELVLYLENEITVAAFTPQRLQVLQILCAQAFISLENARLSQEVQRYSQQLGHRSIDSTSADPSPNPAGEFFNFSEILEEFIQEIELPLEAISNQLKQVQEYIKFLLEHLQVEAQNRDSASTGRGEPSQNVETLFRDSLPVLLNSLELQTTHIRERMASWRRFAHGEPESSTPPGENPVL
jgi:predicted ATPase/GAF domain-containing protein